MYLLLGISLTLALLLIVNLCVAVAASAVWNAVSKYVDGISPGLRAQVIFGLRILPVAAALILVAGFVVPAYVLHEPYGTDEIVSLKLATLAIASSLGFGYALYRVLRTTYVTRQLIRNWLRSAERISLDRVRVPVYRIDHRFPVVAVVGIFRPRIFVAGIVLDALDELEFRATLEHEFGHLAASDNLKRGLLRICRDLLIFPFGKRIDVAWSDNAEAVADEFASRRDEGSALNLASALVKIAKLVPEGAYPAMPAGAYLIEEHVGDVSSRVRRLLDLSCGQLPRSGVFGSGLPPLSLVSTPALVGLVILPFAAPELLSSTHLAIESFVKFLQ